MCGLLETFRDHQRVATINNGDHGTALPSKQGTTQGGLISTTLLNTITVEDQRVAHNGMGEAIRWYLGVFYAGNGMV